MQKPKNACLFLIAALLLSLVGGCSSGGGGGGAAAANLVGKYKVDIDIPADKANDPGAQMAKSMMSGMSLELKADNTFAMNMMMMPMEGTYSVSGDVAELKITKAMGMSMDELKKQSNQPMPANSDKPMKLKIEDGGKTLVPIDDNPKPGDPKMKFVRT